MTGSFASQFKVERFDGKRSFTLWQRRVKNILVQYGSVQALKENDSKPEKMTEKEWKDLESKCISTIKLCIADNIINNVIDEDSASMLWEKFEKLYLEKSLTMKWNLKRDLYRLKMEDGADLMEYLNVFKGLLDQLERVDVKIEKEDQTLLLLTSLPDSFEHIVTTVLYDKNTLQMREIESALLSYEKTRRKVEVNSHDFSRNILKSYVH